MEFFSDWLYHHKKLLIAFVILLLGGVGGAFAMTYEPESFHDSLISDAKGSKTKEEVKEEKIEETPVEETAKEETTKALWRIDIKGAVASPNVYEVYEGIRVYEVIEMAGGLLENATTENINLSKKVSDEMVIYIFTKEEYEKKVTCTIKNEQSAEITKEIQEKTSVIEKTQEASSSQTIISINKATKEELMTLDGIGEAKAESIIKYRTEMGGIKALDELKNISGIGEAIYEKIKNNITL